MNMKKPIIYIILWLVMLFPVLLYGQSANQNYIKTTTYLAENSADSIQTIQYFDGLGRPVQTVQRGITPQGNDLIALLEYDIIGRESLAWLPVYKEANQGKYITPASFKSDARSQYADQYPYSKPVYETSPPQPGGGAIRPGRSLAQ